jgi:agmatine/peptidylarginine deiminase
MPQLKRTAFETTVVNLWKTPGYQKVFKNTPEVHELITIPKRYNDNEPLNSIETEMNFLISNQKITITNFNTNSYYILLLSQMFPMIPQKKNILIRTFSYGERTDKFPTGYAV